MPFNHALINSLIDHTDDFELLLPNFLLSEHVFGLAFIVIYEHVQLPVRASKLRNYFGFDILADLPLFGVVAVDWVKNVRGYCVPVDGMTFVNQVV